MLRLSSACLLPLLLAAGAAGQENPKTPDDEARKLFVEAGFPGGIGFPEVEILYNTQLAHQTIAAQIALNWKTVLGIETKLVNVPWKLYLDRLSSADYAIARRAWIGDYPDPMTFLDLLRSDSATNSTGWKNESYDRLLRKAAAAADPKARMEALTLAEQVVLEEAPIIPLYFYSAQQLYRSDEIQGLPTNAMTVHPLKDVVKKSGKEPLRLHLAGRILSLDPALARGQTEWRILTGIFEGLQALDPKTGRAVAGVAQSYETSQDGKTYTFHLRTCGWSDGRPVTAHDFAYAWKRVLDPAIGSDYAELLHGIKGAAEYGSGKGPASAVAVSAKDDRTLVVELLQPLPYFPELTAYPPFFPVRRDLVEKHREAWTAPANFSGNGPFRLDGWNAEGPVDLTRNAKYWDADHVKQHRVEGLVFENLADAFAGYERKELDVLDGVPLDDFERCSQRPDFHSGTFMATYFYAFNVRRKPFDDKRVRKALSLAIDRTMLCQKTVAGGQKPALRLVPPVFADRGYPSSPPKTDK